MATIKWLRALVVSGVVLGGASVSCSGDGADGCAADTDCKGDRICVDGKCVDGTGGTSSLGEGGGSSQSHAGGTAGSTTPAKPMDGDKCAMSGSNCDPDCLLSCGSAARCVDLCCSDSSSAGVRCDGTCRSPTCTEADSTENWPADLRDRPWVCYEREEAGETFCACTNTLTEADVERVGDIVVESCGGEYCGFDLDGADLLCQCRSDPADIPGWECVMATEEAACCGGNYCSLPRDDCSTQPVLRCANPCEELTIE